MGVRLLELWTPSPTRTARAGCLQGLYQGAPSELDARSRRLRALLRASHLGAPAQPAPLFVFIACTAFDEVLAFESLVELLEAMVGVVPLLLLPDGVSQQAALHRAARDDLAGLLYVLDLARARVEATLTDASRHGQALLLTQHRPLGPAAVRAIARSRAERGFVEVGPAAGAAGPAAYVLLRDVDAATVESALAEPASDQPRRRMLASKDDAPSPGPDDGVLTTLQSTGEVVSAGYAWLDALQGVSRPEAVSVRVRPHAARLRFGLADGRLLGAGPPPAANLANALSPSLVTCHANRGGAGNDLVFGFALGHGCRLAYAEDHVQEAPPGAALVWGVLRGSDDVVRAAIRDDLPFLYCDHAYFRRGHLRNYRVIVNAHATSTLRRCPDDRTARLGATLQPWRKGGRHVLVCPPTDYFLRAHGCPNWLRNTLSTLKHHTDRPIRVRDKPRLGEPSRTLEEDLENCHALVTHSSNVAVEAAVLGVPVFVEPTCAAVGVGRTELEQIEDPWRPDHRELWLANLAHGQFSFEEVLSGSVLPVLADYVQMEPVA